MAVAGWIGSRKQALAEVSEDLIVLQGKIDAAERTAAVEVAKKREPGRLPSGELDWDQVIDWLQGGQSEASEMRSSMKLKKLMFEMSDEELMAAIDEVASLDLGRKIREKLDTMLVDQLIQRDPAMALPRYIDRISDAKRSWSFRRGFATWLSEDPGGAVAWFDDEIGKGTFESRALDDRAGPRAAFEGALLRSLLDGDLAIASARLEGMSEDLRVEVLAERSGLRKGEHVEELATLAREQLSSEKSLEVLGRYAEARVYPKGAESVGSYLEEIDASVEEREGVVERVAVKLVPWSGDFSGEISTESVDEIREWVSEEAPGSMDRVTGGILGFQWKGPSAEARVEMLKEYHAMGAGDEMIMGFLEAGPAMRDPEVIRELAGLVVDEELGNSMLESASALEAQSENPEP